MELIKCSLCVTDCASLTQHTMLQQQQLYKHTSLQLLTCCCKMCYANSFAVLHLDKACPMWLCCQMSL